MKIKLLILSVFFFANSNAQDLLKKYEYKDPIVSQSNYLYRNYIATNNNLLYWNTSFLKTEAAPVIKISPLGTEFIIINENKIGLYNPILFKNEFTTSLKLKNDKVVKIATDGIGKKYYLATLNGKLLETFTNNNSFVTKEVPLDFFVSHIIWNNNMSTLLIADDYYLYNVNSVDFSIQAKVKLEREITSISINEKEFEVAIGLSDGKVLLYDQTLNKLKSKIEISKTPITSIQFDPTDHYLYVGNDKGFLYTYDFLKKKTIKSQEIHSGAVSINCFLDPMFNKKFILTSGNDLVLNVFDISKLEPNYLRIISEKTTRFKENFLKFRNNESSIFYEKRTSNDNISKAIAQARIGVVDSIASTKKNSVEPDFLISDGLLNIEINPFPSVKIKIPTEVKILEGLKYDNLHFALNEDNTFSIDKIDVALPGLDYKLVYNSDKKLMAVNDEVIALALARKIAKDEETLKSNLTNLVTELRSKGELNDVDLKLESYLKKEKDSLGNDELNLHIAFLTQGINAKVEKNTADFAPGKYSLFESKAARTLVSFFIKSVSEKLSEYLQPNTRVTFKLTGATDKSKIISAIPYNNEYGVFKNFPYYSQSSLAGMNLSKETGIADNNQLCF
jgi:WD40 repeat protein